jgi:hypothetical protein
MNRPTPKPTPELTPEERLAGVVRILIEAALAKMRRMKEADEVSEKVSSSASILKRNPKERR